MRLARLAPSTPWYFRTVARLLVITPIALGSVAASRLHSAPMRWKISRLPSSVQVGP